MESFYIQTFGCQMNEADTERMRSLLKEQGLHPSESPESADLILLNGCTVREKAVHKALSSLGEFRALKRSRGRGPFLGMGGCVGQLDQHRLFQQAPGLDFVFGTDTIDQLPEMLYRLKQGERQFVMAEWDPSLSYSTETRLESPKAQAFVNIMKGCDKYCSYCIVPYTRGKEKSRVISEVVADIARLVAMGIREVTLLGQNVNSFGKGNPNTEQRFPQQLHNPIGKVGPEEGDENFPQLLRALDTDPRCRDLKRIRFTSSHPLDFSDELIQCYAPVAQGGVERLAPHLHLPVQSGSNAVLQKMGRHHRIEHYLEQMERLRALCPGIGITTDLIVGFPTETEADFEATLRLLDQMQYDSIYAFAYSPRPGTRAAKLPETLSAEEKNERLQRLFKHQQSISEKRAQTRVGKIFEILVEGPAKNQLLFPPTEGEGAPRKVWSGKTGCHKWVHFATSSPRDLTGKFLTVKVQRATALSLEGEWLTDEGGDTVS